MGKVIGFHKYSLKRTINKIRNRMPKLHPFAIIGIILLATFLTFLWNELRDKDLDAIDDELQVASYMEEVIYDSIYKGDFP